MSLIGPGNGFITQNILPSFASTILQDGRNTVEAFRLVKVRKDMNQSEYTQYKVNWDYFNTVWAYNYTVSTLNGPLEKPKYSWWQHLTRSDLSAYSNGQLAHISAYPSTAVTGLFNNFS